MTSPRFYVRDIKTGQDYPVLLSALGDGTFVPNLRTGESALKSASFTRPADTIQYADGDAVNNSTTQPVAMLFSGTVRAVGLGAALFGVRLKKTTASTTNAAFRLYLFRGSSAPTPANDNTAYSMSATDGANLLGWVDFGTSDWIAGTGFAACQGVIKGDRIAIANLAATTCYGLLVARAAYTPDSEEQFTVELDVVQD